MYVLIIFLPVWVKVNDARTLVEDTEQSLDKPGYDPWLSPYIETLEDHEEKDITISESSAVTPCCPGPDTRSDSVSGSTVLDIGGCIEFLCAIFFRIPMV